MVIKHAVWMELTIGDYDSIPSPCLRLLDQPVVDIRRHIRPWHVGCFSCANARVTDACVTGQCVTGQCVTGQYVSTVGCVKLKSRRSELTGQKRWLPLQTIGCVVGQNFLMSFRAEEDPVCLVRNFHQHYHVLLNASLAEEQAEVAKGDSGVKENNISPTNAQGPLSGRRLVLDIVTRYLNALELRLRETLVGSSDVGLSTPVANHRQVKNRVRSTEQLLMHKAPSVPPENGLITEKKTTGSATGSFISNPLAAIAQTFSNSPMDKPPMCKPSVSTHSLGSDFSHQVDTDLAPKTDESIASATSKTPVPTGIGSSTEVSRPIGYDRQWLAPLINVNLRVGRVKKDGPTDIGVVSPESDELCLNGMTVPFSSSGHASISLGYSNMFHNTTNHFGADYIGGDQTGVVGLHFDDLKVSELKGSDFVGIEDNFGGSAPQGKESVNKGASVVEGEKSVEEEAFVGEEIRARDVGPVQSDIGLPFQSASSLSTVLSSEEKETEVLGETLYILQEVVGSLKFLQERAVLVLILCDVSHD
ncbi:hypothetical protein GNI_139260, partial [Gregarina niphandrodes]